jgi:hypothetical protein
MTTIAVFYQAEALGRVEHANYPAETTLGGVLADLRTRLGANEGALLFLEDADDPADLGVRLQDLDKGRGVKVHVHRCHHVVVSVSFNGKVKEHRFAPAAMVARVKRWATEAFGMSPEEAAEHVLQLTGTTDRPSPGTHLGTLATHPKCQVSFDLVPNERVNGACGYNS